MAMAWVDGHGWRPMAGIGIKREGGVEAMVVW